jgi:hypothetical protein
MNRLVSALDNFSNYKTTENGATALKSTKSMVYDMFALGGAYRSRSEADCVLLFKSAIEENPLLGLKCLFYLRDAREGQGERRFFRVCLNWLANNYPGTVLNNLDLISEYGRWDDLYCLVGTSIEDDMFAAIRKQINLDLESKTPSLCAKWLKSENTSSKLSCELGNRTRKALGLSHKQYRKVLTHLRGKINIVERLMSANRWDLIEFDKLPSKAGFIYKNAFARRDIIKEKYKAFAEDKNTKVNAAALYPHEVVEKALQARSRSLNDTDRLMVNKYWENLPNWVKDANFNGICVCDTSGSMWGTPINVAISLSLYCAERAGGPFANHYISFASRPQLIETNGVDFVDKVDRIYATNLVDNTNIEAVFDLLLNTAIKSGCSQEEIPQNVVIISDMQMDAARGYHRYYDYRTGQYVYNNQSPVETLMESIRTKWAQYGLKLPHLVYWNVDARDNTILDGSPDVSYVSGFSPSIFKSILTGKTGIDLMYEALNNERYAVIH